MDLFSQAEHDELAQSILLCPDAAYIEQVQAAIDRLLPSCRVPGSLPNHSMAARPDPYPQHGRACAISNRIAPEHLEISSLEPHRWSLCSGTPAPSFWAPTAANRWATTAPARTTCCHQRHRRFSSRSGSMTSKNEAA